MSESIPATWATAPVGDICASVAKTGPDRSKPTFEYVDLSSIERSTKTIKGGTTVKTSAAPSRAKQVLKCGDVLFSNVRVYLENIAQVPRALDGEIGSTAFCVLRPTEGIDARYLYHYVSSRKFVLDVNALQRGNSPPSVQDSDVREQMFPVAPANEQRRIVSKIDELLSRIDEGEQALQRVTKLVERYRQSVLKDAVTGRLTRDWREARKRAGEPVESGEALLARILKARRAAWEQAELAKLTRKGKTPTDDRWKCKYQEPAPPDATDLPELPEGWVWASPVQLESDDAHALTIGPFGSDLKVSDYATSGVPLIFVRNIRSVTFDGDDTKYVSVEKAHALSAHEARGGDLLITKMGDPPGDACVYPHGTPNAIVTADCIKWTLHPLAPSPEFVCSFVTSRLGKMQIRGITTGVAQQKVSLSRFRKIAICLPGQSEQREINDCIASMFEQATQVARAIGDGLARASALRQSILKAAFSGQLVPQDPNDEPASKLLERIAGERASAAAPRKRTKKTA